MRHVGDFERPVGAVQRPGQARIALAFAEIGQHIVKAPAAAAERAPIVVIFALAADIDAAIDRAAAAEHAPLRHHEAAPVGGGLGLGLEDEAALGAEEIEGADRHAHPHTVVVRAFFEQKNARVASFAQSFGEHATGRAAADDDVVEFLAGTGAAHGFFPTVASMTAAMSFMLRREISSKFCIRTKPWVTP